MTVIFGQPSTGQPFGPGVTYSVRSDLVGPVAGATWRVSLSLVTGTLGNYQSNFAPADFHVFSIREFMAEGSGTMVLVPLLSNLLAASSGFLVAQLLDNTFSVVEQGEVAVSLTWLGLSVLLSRQLQRGVVAGVVDVSTILAAVQKVYSNA